MILSYHVLEQADGFILVVKFMRIDPGRFGKHNK